MLSDKKNKIIVIFILFFAAFYCTLPLFINQGIPNGHDTNNHIFRAEQFNKVLNDGIVFPRWIPDANNGYGSPTFIFYSPLFYYVVSAIHFMGPPLIMSMVLAVWLSFFLSGFTMYLLSKNMFGSTGGLLSAVAYQVLPFHLIDLYIRAAFTELFAFLWFPLIILFLHKTLTTDSKKAPIGLCISYAGLIYTHLKCGFMFTFVIGVYLLYSYFLLKNRKPLINALLALTLGLALSSYYLIPVVFEWKLVYLEYLVQCSFCDFTKSFLLLWSNLEDVCLLMNMVLGIEVILFLVIISFLYENYIKSTSRPYRNIMVIIFLLAFFLTIPLSRPLWGLIPFFPYLQFPWRWLSIMEFSLCLLIGCVFSSEEMPRSKSNELKKKIILFLLIAVFVFSFIIIIKNKNSNNYYLSKTFNPAVMKYYVEPSHEYIPRGTGNIEEITSEKRHEHVSILSGYAKIRIREWKSGKRAIIINAYAPSMLRFSTFYYPGWKAYLDGVEMPIKTEENDGAMLVNIPKGTHALLLKFEDTPVRHYAKIISLASVLIVLSLVLFSAGRRRGQ